MAEHTVVLQNDTCAASFNLKGGSLVNFSLQPAGVNPMNFCREEGGLETETVFFRGHFLCLGRWGDPSPAEAREGHVKHGDFNRLDWQVAAGEKTALFSAHSSLEGLGIKRDVVLDAASAVLLVSESVQNTNPVGRLYNMVQHPTLSAPFLNVETVIDCNAATGFDYAFDRYNEGIFSRWPEVRTVDGGSVNLVKSNRAYSSVFPFIVNPSDEWGWVTAYSPMHQTVLGYVWKRRHYAWIAHWLHFEKGQMLYRGLEFGTTGVHKPVKEIWEKGLVHLLGEDTCCFIDTGETQKRAYMTFLLPVPAGFKGVQNVSPGMNAIVIAEKESSVETKIYHHLNIADAFQE